MSEPTANEQTTTREQAVAAEDLEALRAKAAERDQYFEMVLRAKAEFENYQKRNQREREQERKYWYTPLALDLLPVLDNLERALAAAEQGGDKDSLVQGVAMVESQFLDLLKRHGVTRMDAAPGKTFDPNLHQAVMQQPTTEFEPGMIVQALEQGFMNHDRVLRPAMVIVSSKPE